MILKSIEIRGFKSFADKTEIDFKKGITTVVGPNGSGKSNVSDAVKWVLGEQSVKSLRGSKMEDIIFAGTEFRKPLGLAQVSLFLDNEDRSLNIDYSQVKITRRLYRSGESDYLINNSRCRLKDIQELFMDTGIGKEGYSIIGQGKIDAILGGKPEDRRSLLEEAAGIVKYKSRKEEAEKKLQNTDDNLVRIVDILKTYEERLLPLEEEMKKAKEFLDLSASLKKVDVSLIVNNLNSIEIKLNDITDKKQEKIISTQNLIMQRNRLKELLKSKKDELNIHESDSKSNRELYYSVKENINSIESEIGLFNEKINGYKSLIIRYDDEISNLKDSKTEISHNKLLVLDDLEDIKEEFNRAKDSFDKIKSEIQKDEQTIQKFNQSTKELRDRLDNINAIELENKDKLNSAKSSYNLSEDVLFNINDDILNLNNALKINENTIISFNKEMNKLNDNVIVIDEFIKESDSKLRTYRSKYKNEQNQNTKIRIELANEEQKLKLLEELENKHEGYSRTSKEIVNRVTRGIVEGVKDCFIVGDVINVEKKYEKAIETAIGPAISNLITNNDSEAKVLIEHLKRNKLGRATFLPLNIIKPRTLSSLHKVKDEEGFIAAANMLVNCNEKFKKAIDFILGNIIIASSMDTALLIAKKINYSNRIVTLQGDVINLGGSLTGGSSYSKNLNIIGRKREIANINSIIETFKIDINNSLENIQKYEININEEDENNIELKNKRHLINLDVVRIKEKIDNLINEKEKYNSKLNTLYNKINDNKLIMENNEALIIKLQKEIETLINERQSIEKSLTSGGPRVKTIIDSLEDKKAEGFDNQLEMTKISEIIKSKKEKIAAFDTDISLKISRLESLTKEKEDYAQNIIKHELNIKNHNIKLTLLMQKVKELEGTFKEADGKEIFMKKTIEELEGKVEDRNLVIDNEQKELNKAELQLSKVEGEKYIILTRLNTEYNLTLAEAMEFKKDKIDISVSKKEIQEYKSKIKALGMVNVASIEEYKEVNGKYTFMKEQKDDLENSKVEIIKVIDEMINKMKVIFKENFVILNENFHETFSELFKGGSASLILEEGDELNGKIEINVQPPGKKLQNISLMSGGEKVLSAIALLFAILKMKPTPFCILDEIEAALDDANVARYAEFLREFSDKIQFIVITHRKGTMEVSDAIYGITMEEKGISKLVSLELNKNMNY